MRQLIAVALFCAGLFCIAQAQVSQTGAGLGAPSSGFNASCSQSSNFLNRATNLAGNTADETIYDTLICGLQTDGVFAELDALWTPMIAPDATTAALNLVSGSFGLTPVNSPTFTAYLGYAGNGSNTSITTGLTPGSGTLYSQSSASFGGCDMTSGTSTGSDALMGAQNTGAGVFIDLLPMLSASSALGRVNQLGGASQSGTNANRLGFYAVVATGLAAQQLYKQTTNIGSNGGNTQSLTSMAAFVLLGRNDSGTVSSFTSDTLGAAFVGQALSSTDEGNLRARLNTAAGNHSSHSC